ncbi:MAG: hypothetical protein MHPSP_004428, partial [Paramarteilia canceri]
IIVPELFSTTTAQDLFDIVWSVTKKPMKALHIHTDNSSSNELQFGIVEFGSTEEAKFALDKLNQQNEDTNGKKIMFYFAKSNFAT